MEPAGNHVRRFVETRNHIMRIYLDMYLYHLHYNIDFIKNQAFFRFFYMNHRHFDRTRIPAEGYPAGRLLFVVDLLENFLLICGMYLIGSRF